MRFRFPAPHGRGALVFAVPAIAAALIVPAQAGATTFGVPPDADAYVNDAKPSTNFGASRKLNVDARPFVRSYLRFSVAGLDGPVARARLRLTALAGHSVGVSLHPVADTTWGERTITSANAPATGAVLRSTGPIATGAVEIDVTELVTGDGAVGFALTTTGTSTAGFGSREDADAVPALIVDTTTVDEDTTPPVVTLDTPADGATIAAATPRFAGGAGTAVGDSSIVTVRVYAGTLASGLPVQEISALRSGGAWEADATSPLEDGVYTVRAEQSDDASNTGASAAHTFTIDTSSPCPSPGYAELVRSSPGVIRHWRFDETSGTVAADAIAGGSGTYRGGFTLGRPGALACDPGTAVGLDGTSAYVDVASSPALAPANAITLEAWIRPRSVSTRQTVARKDGSYLLRVVNGRAVFRLWTAGGAETELLGPATLSVDEYQHLVASYDGSTMRLYVDAELIASRGLSGTLAATTSSLRLGSSGGYDFLGGDLDEVALYGAALSAADVTSHHAAATAVGPPPPPPPPGDVVLAAGDIAACDGSGDEQTATILDGQPGTVLALGDLAYPDGTAQQFAECYGPSWGRHRERTRPVPGNHEYATLGAQPYYDYFGAAAGPAGLGYYSFDIGSWHVVALNSNCDAVGGCHAGSQQEQWLRADLAANPSQCTLAFWHHPRFSSDSVHGSDTDFTAFWQAVHEAGADIVLVGHSHDYERFAPQSASGVPDPGGPRQFVVGTGGRGHYTFGTVVPNSEVRETGTFGVLKLTLREGSYDWRFLPVAGETFTDSGTDTC